MHLVNFKSDAWLTHASTLFVAHAVPALYCDLMLWSVRGWDTDAEVDVGEGLCPSSPLMMGVHVVRRP